MLLNISANQSMPFSVGYVGYCQINVSKRAGNIEKMKLNQTFLKIILSIAFEVLISLAPLVEIKNIIFLRKLSPMWTAIPLRGMTLSMYCPLDIHVLDKMAYF